MRTSTLALISAGALLGAPLAHAQTAAPSPTPSPTAAAPRTSSTAAANRQSGTQAMPAAAAPAASPSPAAAPGATAAQVTGAPASPPADPNAAPNPTVGGAPMLASKTIVDNASAAPNLSTLVAAVKAADLVATLSGPGPFTVFAPTNDAFSRLSKSTLDTLMKPENKASLAKVLTYHVVAGKISLADLKAKTAAGGGTTTLTTVAGQPLTVTYANNVMAITDVNGNKSYVETPDVMQSNGVVHVVNGVLVPKLS